MEEVHYNTQEAPRPLRLRSSSRRLRKRARERAAPVLCERLRSSWFGGTGWDLHLPESNPAEVIWRQRLWWP